MNKKILMSLTIIFFFGATFCANILAWDDKITHKDISEYAAEISILNKDKSNYMKNIGLNNALDEYLVCGSDKKKIREWLRYGAELEDAGSKTQALMGQARSNNHFHNPLKAWAEAGLSDMQAGESSLKWAQDGSAQLNRVEGDWSWQKVREYFYTALTGRDFNGSIKATTEEQRGEYFARIFRGLGHQMHLVQDSSVPEHVRNDAHPLDSILGKNPQNGIAYFETWAKKSFNNLNALKSFTPNPVFPNVAVNVSHNGLVPTTQLVDSDTYDGFNVSAGINQGLAEYTNANFFSDDTIFAAERYSASDRHYFPFPKKSSTDMQSYISQIKPLLVQVAEDGIQDKGLWIKKERDGEAIEHFVRASRWTSKIYKTVGEGTLFYNSFYRDEKCYEDYAAFLLPRAVGYSAALLNYFFRGQLDITAPDEYVYSIIDGSKTPQQFTNIKAKIKNTTPNEAMLSGTLTAVAKYKKRTDYQPDLSSDPPGLNSMEPNFSYSVSSARGLMPEELATLNVYPMEFTFDFTQDPIPAGITDLSLQIVFKGTLGGEADSAIAIGMKNLIEPTHQVWWNLSDMFSLNGHLYTADQIRNDPALLKIVTDDQDNIDPYSVDFKFAYSGTYPPGALTTVAEVQQLPPGRYVRLLSLVDRYDPNYVRLTWNDGIYQDTYYDFSFSGGTNEEADNVFYYTSPKTFRSVKGHDWQGVLHCDPVTGPEACAYPENEAIAPPTLAPYPVTIKLP